MSLKLHDFTLESKPKYAILSHTWGDGEVTFQDMSSPNRFRMEGYNKIVGTCELANRKGFEYVWIDTCCIDKSSSAELGEAINSMFQWYEDATVCYVYLDDIGEDQLEISLPKCRWFGRGWTLQELIAPTTVQFYDKRWTRLGNKVELVDILSKATGIPRTILDGRRDSSLFSVATRMSWASRRETTRVEDAAYCLLGIFKVNMPLIYGEGERAFRRLQEEIVRRSTDMTIFAWDPPRNYPDKQFISLLAPSASAFTFIHTLDESFNPTTTFSVTNAGMLFTGGWNLVLNEVATSNEKVVQRYWLKVGGLGGGLNSLLLCLRKVGPNLFCRDGNFSLQRLDYLENTGLERVEKLTIVLDPKTNLEASLTHFRENNVSIPSDGKSRLKRVRPAAIWDWTDRTFLWHFNDIAAHENAFACSLSISLPKTYISFVVVGTIAQDVPFLKVFNSVQYAREATWIFLPQHRDNALSRSELAFYTPEILALDNSMIVKAAGQPYRISASTVRQRISIASTDDSCSTYALSLSVERV